MDSTAHDLTGRVVQIGSDLSVPTNCAYAPIASCTSNSLVVWGNATRRLDGAGNRTVTIAAPAKWQVYDYHLRPASPMKNLGLGPDAVHTSATLVYRYDGDGQPRAGATCDIGPDELKLSVLFQTDGTPDATVDDVTAQSLEYGADCTPVTANAPEGSHFVKWTCDSADYATSNPLTVKNVTDSLTLIAHFTVPIHYTLLYTAGPNGSISGAASQTVNPGTSGTLVTAVPDANYHFAAWSDGYPTAARLDTNVTTNVTASASFAINQHMLTYTAGTHGTIIGVSPQTVDHGASGSEVTAVPSVGYHFAAWSDGVMTIMRTDENVTANIRVTATFADGRNAARNWFRYK